MQQEEDQIWEQNNNFFYTYLHDEENTEKINEMIVADKTRFIINLDNLRRSNQEIVDQTLAKPIKSIRSLQKHLQTICEENDQNNANQNKKLKAGNVTQKTKIYNIGFEGNLGRQMVTPRGLNSTMVDKLVGIQGIITKQSIVKPKLVQSVHYCDQTEKGHVKEYVDEYNLHQNPNQQFLIKHIPVKDNDGHPMVVEHGYCKFRDHQTITIQELPENAPTGLLPRSVEVVLEDDLINSCKPGDRVQIMGIYKCIATNYTQVSGIFKTVLIATNVGGLSNDVQGIKLSPEDIKKIRELQKNKNLYEILSQSISPSIFGHEFVKKAILLQLIGGVEKNLNTGTHLRGDINIMMIGDPGTAKSQMLRYVLNTAPLALNTTGRGSSGVGLTAAVVSDKETGEKHLEAGAMVLADRGIVCIDEFDKMNEGDRVAIHEVMEQQTVTIAKAGIHCSLNARCSVIAAANPIYGEYAKDLPPTVNIGMPDSLLSRFDLLFIILDEKSTEIDRMIAERVTKNHRSNVHNLGNLFSGNLDENFIIEEPMMIEENNDREEFFEKKNSKTLKQIGLKKYIQYAKKLKEPLLEMKSIEFLSKAWSVLRQKDLDQRETTGTAKVLPITIRTYETLIRLATAHAKMRLSQNIDIEDCKVAVSLLSFSLFQEKDDGDYEDDGKMDDEDFDDKPSKKKTGFKKFERKDEKQQQTTPTKKSKEPTQRQTRSSQRIEDSNIPSEKVSKAKTQQQEAKKQTQKINQMTQGVQKIRIDDTEEVNKMLDKQQSIAAKCSIDQKKCVYQALTTAFSQQKQDEGITQNELWKHLESKFLSKIHSRDIMKQGLEILSEANKIIIDEKTDNIIIC